MMVDPDGELAFLAIAGIILKAAAISAGVSAVSYASTTAISGNSWDWGQFAKQVGKGAAIGGLTAGAGLGFSAGLHAAGMGVQASNFVGGALGSFSGTLLGNGMPANPVEWATALGGAALTGNAFKNSNPLSLKRTGIDNSLLGPSSGFIDLPSVTYTDMAAGNYASWWGQTGTFLNPVARAVAFQGFYNGIIDNVSNFFAGDSPEINWYRQSDGSYFPLVHSQFVGGDIPFSPGGVGSGLPKGFKLAKEFGYKHGQKVYFYKGKYYSKDIDSHIGGVWKVFKKTGGKLKRIGTVDKNLNIIGK